jgi:hypothetical protein
VAISESAALFTPVFQNETCGHLTPLAARLPVGGRLKNGTANIQGPWHFTEIGSSPSPGNDWFEGKRAEDSKVPIPVVCIGVAWEYAARERSANERLF